MKQDRLTQNPDVPYPLGIQQREWSRAFSNATTIRLRENVEHTFKMGIL